ncbi:bifunctional phosphoglucose/phosphomannose isomerase [bacterium]|nr:bifunctional phosphoglucose/phosphomannose isomerase [bacterium]
MQFYEKDYSKYDTFGMHAILVRLHEQIAEGFRLGSEVDLSSIKNRAISNIILCGMGGSAIGGDLLRSYTADELECPFIINRNYSIPGFVSSNTLMIASSYSGNTEETLTSYSYGLKTGAQIICISTNGKLSELAVTNNNPMVALPAGLPPRAALGYSFTPLLVMLWRLGLITDKKSELDETIDYIRNQASNLSNDIPFERNEAKQLAFRMKNKLPIFYTPPDHFDVLGVRFRGQVEENAKMLAYSAVFPEMNHNELVGWNHFEAYKNSLLPVFIMDSSTDPRINYRMELTAEIMKEMGVESIIINTKGDSLLTRIFSIIQIADFTSYYLAILNQEDPTPIGVIKRLKKALSKFQEDRKT